MVHMAIRVVIVMVMAVEVVLGGDGGGFDSAVWLW